MLHHYTEYLEEATVREAEHEAIELLAEYEALEGQYFPRKGKEASGVSDEELYPQLYPAF